MLRILRRRLPNKPVELVPDGILKGRVLFSYLDTPVLLEENDLGLSGHSNKWESRKIAKIFQVLGYVVDAISWENTVFIPRNKYDIVFDIYTNLSRLSTYYKSNTKKLLHLTGSYGPYQNAAEKNRIKGFRERTGVIYTPKRLVGDLMGYEKSLKIADACSLIGNEHTLSTFPSIYRDKITLVTVSATNLDYFKVTGNLVPREKEFLWFFGSGAVHKGLDLLLEVFSRRENVLNIVGNIADEADFFQAYWQTIEKCPNINYYGYLDVNAHEFRSIVQRCFCFIAPSCSESISAAAATCLQIGLYPIVSVDTGITLPRDYGKYLFNCSIEEIELAIDTVLGLNDSVVREQIMYLQKYAQKKYSRDEFSNDMQEYLVKVLSD